MMVDSKREFKAAKSTAENFGMEHLVEGAFDADGLLYSLIDTLTTSDSPEAETTAYVMGEYKLHLEDADD